MLYHCNTIILEMKYEIIISIHEHINSTHIQGGPKKPGYFVFCLKFVVFIIFSKFLRHIVGKYQEISPCKFQICTTKTISAAVIDRQIFGF